MTGASPLLLGAVHREVTRLKALSSEAEESAVNLLAKGQLAPADIAFLQNLDRISQGLGDCMTILDALLDPAGDAAQIAEASLPKRIKLGEIRQDLGADAALTPQQTEDEFF